MKLITLLTAYFATFFAVVAGTGVRGHKSIARVDKASSI